MCQIYAAFIQWSLEHYCTSHLYSDQCIPVQLSQYLHIPPPAVWHDITPPYSSIVTRYSRPLAMYGHYSCGTVDNHTFVLRLDQIVAQPTHVRKKYILKEEMPFWLMHLIWSWARSAKDDNQQQRSCHWILLCGKVTNRRYQSEVGERKRRIWFWQTEIGKHKLGEQQCERHTGSLSESWRLKVEGQFRQEGG